MKKAEVLNKLTRGDVHPDKLIQKKDGSFEFRREYFYRHGQTTEHFVKAILRVFPDAKIVASSDHWAPWPKDSYFMVQFKL